MGDKLKEFFSGTLTTANIVSGNKLQLITNNATTQAVVKDIQIESSSGFQTIGLYNGEVKIDDGVNSLAGSELVEVSKTLEYRLTPAVPTTYTVTGYEFFYPTSNTVIKYNNSLTGVSGLNGYSLNVDLLTSAPDIIVPHNNMSYIFRYTNSIFYYIYTDGNSTTTVYRSTSFSLNNIPSWNTINTTSYSFPTIDVQGGKIYWVDGQTYRVHTMSTNITDSVTHTNRFPASASSFNRSYYCNGYVFTIISSSYTSSIYFLKVSDSSTGQLTLATALYSNSHSIFSVSYNTAENMFYFITNSDATNYRIHKIASGFTHLSAVTYVGNTGLPFGFPYTTHCHPYLDDGFVMVRSGTQMLRWKMTSSGFSDATAVTGSLTYSNAHAIACASQNVNLTEANSSIDASIKLKVAGVEITP